jgi:hypothetical protein
MYQRGITPQTINQQFIYGELRKIEESIKIFDFIPLRILNVAPSKPSPGLYAADGTNWDPGTGAGVYYFNGSTYTKL